MYAIKFHSTMTDNKFYICSTDEQILYDNLYEIQKAFFNMVFADEYTEREAYIRYVNLIEDLELTEIDNTETEIDETTLDIAHTYTSRF